MPNWCENTLTIRGNNETVKKFIESSVEVDANQQIWLRLGKLVPAPDNENDDILGWRDWRITNWGCKWECEIYSMEIFEGFAILKFDSPWSPPYEWLKTVSSKFFPDLHFRMSFLEPGIWFCGAVDGENGWFTEYQGDIITTDENGIRVEWDNENSLYRYSEGKKDYLDEDFYPEYYNSCDYER
jgi:hypothetical protein